jgi:acetyltransferase-like isoleucine patch superfamily enzyme
MNIVGVDIGGTFTDLVGCIDGKIVTSKTSTTPADPTNGVAESLRLAKTDLPSLEEVLHGSTIGENTLVGINAVILNGCVIGRNCIIGANALLPEGKVIPDNSLVVGSPGKVVRQLSDEDAANLRRIATGYAARGAQYNRAMKLLAP